MYILKTQVYRQSTADKQKSTTSFATFDEFKDAVEAAEHTAKVVGSILDLTRHSSCIAPVKHCDYYMDGYNELFLEVKVSTN